MWAANEGSWVLSKYGTARQKHVADLVHADAHVRGRDKLEFAARFSRVFVERQVHVKRQVDIDATAPVAAQSPRCLVALADLL